MESYQTQVIIKRSPEVVFEAICSQLEKWWGYQDQPVTKEGIEFKVSWGEPWYAFRVIKYQQDEEMVWECIDANQIINGLEGVQKEWVGTKVYWKLSELEKDTTLLEFKHEGLIPSFICYKVCSHAWSGFLEHSLVEYAESTV